MNNEVYIVKTTDGYELIGVIVKLRNDEVIRVMDPLEIRYRVSPVTGGSVAVLVPYNAFGIDRFVDIFRSSLVCIYRTTDEYAKTYVESLKSIEEQLKNKGDSTTTEVTEKLKTAVDTPAANNTVH